MSQEIRGFIKEALERGHSREEIHRVLLEAGWQEPEIRKGLSGFSDVDFSIPVPRPTPYLYAREAFLYLVSFIALYVAAISFGLLAFGLIDYSFPDALDHSDRYPSGGEATAIASVIIAFPLFLFLARWLTRMVAADPERRQSLVRRWLTYFTLVVAAGIILGDLIALVANVLTGDPTIRFILKALSVLAIAGCVFGYYLWDMRRTEAEVSESGTPTILRVLVAVVVIAVIGCVVYAFVLMGSPGKQREIRLDRERVSHLSNIADNIDVYWELNGELPADLVDMSGPRYFLNRIHDPDRGGRYEYRVIEDDHYELCAVFSRATSEADSSRNFSDRAWDHQAGRTCFTLQAQAP